MTFEKGQSLFFLVMLASELLGLDDSEAVLPIPNALVKLDDKDGDKAEPIVTPSLTLHPFIMSYFVLSSIGTGHLGAHSGMQQSLEARHTLKPCGEQHAKAPETEEVVGSEPLLAKNPQHHLASI